MKNNVCGLYSITNKLNNKFYIGSSKNIAERFKKHLVELKNNNHPNKYLQNAVNKDGIHNFKFEVIKELPIDQLLIIEQQYIDNSIWSNLYNLSKIAKSGGGDVVRKELLLLDLKGDIIKLFNSGIEVAKFLKIIAISYPTINTPTISKKLYRIVTPEFYKTSIDIIKSWKPYSTTPYKYRKTYKYQLNTITGEIKLFCTKQSLADYLNTNVNNIRRAFKLIDTKGLDKYVNKKTAVSIQYVKKTR
jgi:group I intron endonuclease